ncbi:hypothetical protein ACP3TB_11495 [Rahnella variigena]|uniref:hypothetical protein n=1 Tax=Rahnella TaxID=34037 RepID=UPI001E32B73C|nr:MULTISPECIES: hypothetical protein [Rahnella]MDH2898237.1 hypothetical protein [Rahnella variigena]
MALSISALNVSAEKANPGRDNNMKKDKGFNKKERAVVVLFDAPLFLSSPFLLVLPLSR